MCVHKQSPVLCTWYDSDTAHLLHGREQRTWPHEEFLPHTLLCACNNEQYDDEDRTPPPQRPPPPIPASTACFPSFINLPPHDLHAQTRFILPASRACDCVDNSAFSRTATPLCLLSSPPRRVAPTWSPPCSSSPLPSPSAPPPALHRDAHSVPCASSAQSVDLRPHVTPVLCKSRACSTRNDEHDKADVVLQHRITLGDGNTHAHMTALCETKHTPDENGGNSDYAHSRDTYLTTTPMHPSVRLMPTHSMRLGLHDEAALHDAHTCARVMRAHELVEVSAEHSDGDGLVASRVILPHTTTESVTMLDDSKNLHTAEKDDEDAAEAENDNNSEEKHGIHERIAPSLVDKKAAAFADDRDKHDNEMTSTRSRSNSCVSQNVNAARRAQAVEKYDEGVLRSASRPPSRCNSHTHGIKQSATKHTSLRHTLESYTPVCVPCSSSADTVETRDSARKANRRDRMKDISSSRSEPTSKIQNSDTSADAACAVNERSRASSASSAHITHKESAKDASHSLQPYHVITDTLAHTTASAERRVRQENYMVARLAQAHAQRLLHVSRGGLPATVLLPHRRVSATLYLSANEEELHVCVHIDNSSSMCEAAQNTSQHHPHANEAEEDEDDDEEKESMCGTRAIRGSNRSNCPAAQRARGKGCESLRRSKHAANVNSDPHGDASCANVVHPKPRTSLLRRLWRGIRRLWRRRSRRQKELHAAAPLHTMSTPAGATCTPSQAQLFSSTPKLQQQQQQSQQKQCLPQAYSSLQHSQSLLQSPPLYQDASWQHGRSLQPHQILSHKQVLQVSPFASQVPSLQQVSLQKQASSLPQQPPSLQQSPFLQHVSSLQPCSSLQQHPSCQARHISKQTTQAQRQPSLQLAKQVQASAQPSALAQAPIRLRVPPGQQQPKRVLLRATRTPPLMTAQPVCASRSDASLVSPSDRLTCASGTLIISDTTAAASAQGTASCAPYRSRSQSRHASAVAAACTDAQYAAHTCTGATNPALVHSAHAHEVQHTPPSSFSTLPPPRRQRHRFPLARVKILLPFAAPTRMSVGPSAGTERATTEYANDSVLLCGTQALRLLRRHRCTLFAQSELGQGKARRLRRPHPYRLYLIFPRHERVDDPAEAVLVVMELHSRADWVTCVVALQGAQRAAAMRQRQRQHRQGQGLAWEDDEENEEEKNGSGGSAERVLSYGRALWLLAMQRVFLRHQIA